MRFECGPEWDIRVIDIKPKNKIGIMMTGGIDSLVLYNLLKIVMGDPSKILIFNVIASGDHGEGYDSPERVSLLTDRYDIIKIDKYIKHTENDKPYYKPWTEVLDLSQTHMLEDFDIDELYIGMNMNPPTEFFPEFDTSDKPRRFWYTQETSETSRMPKSALTKMRAPFLNLYKYHILDLANKNNIDLRHTQSCQEYMHGHCGECWWCLERTWGYNQLKITK